MGKVQKWVSGEKGVQRFGVSLEYLAQIIEEIKEPSEQRM